MVLQFNSQKTEGLIIFLFPYVLIGYIFNGNSCLDLLLCIQERVCVKGELQGNALQPLQ